MFMEINLMHVFLLSFQERRGNRLRQLQTSGSTTGYSRKICQRGRGIPKGFDIVFPIDNFYILQYTHIHIYVYNFYTFNK